MMSKPMRLDKFQEYLQAFAEEYEVTITVSHEHAGICPAIIVRMLLRDTTSSLCIVRVREGPYLNISGVLLYYNLLQMLRVVGGTQPKKKKETTQ